MLSKRLARKSSPGRSSSFLVRLGRKRTLALAAGFGQMRRAASWQLSITATDAAGTADRQEQPRSRGALGPRRPTKPTSIKRKAQAWARASIAGPLAGTFHPAGGPGFTPCQHVPAPVQRPVPGARLRRGFVLDRSQGHTFPELLQGLGKTHAACGRSQLDLRYAADDWNTRQERSWCWKQSDLSASVQSQMTTRSPAAGGHLAPTQSWPA